MAKTDSDTTRARQLAATLADRDRELAEADTTIATQAADIVTLVDQAVYAEATIKQLRADVAARDNTLRVEVAARDKRIVAQRDEMDARGKRIAELIIAFNGEVATVAERDATIEQLRADTDRNWGTFTANHATIATLQDRNATLQDVNDKLRCRVLELEDKYEPAPVLSVNLSGFEGEETPPGPRDLGNPFA